MKSAIISLILIFSISSFAEEDINSYLTFNGFQLEKTTIQDVLKSYGVTEIHQEGDAGDSYTAICYHYPKQNVTVYFESGEMGGGETLLSYKFTAGLEHKFPCGNVNEAGSAGLKLASLKIGMKTESALSSLPKNPHTKEGLTFTYWNKIPFTQEEIVSNKVKDMQYAFWDEIITIEIHDEKGLVNGFSVSKATSW
ncbi:MAG: hypothetical protein QM709_02995 [Spongiibacteraceae bacterium]